MEKKLYKFVFILVAIALALAFLFPAERKAYNLENTSFDAQQSTTLFFKNTRAFYYGLEEMPEAGFDVYRYGKTTQADTGIFLNFIIVHNWRTNEVYIVTEPSTAFLNLCPVTITFGDSTFLFDKSVMNNNAQFEFAAKVFLALLENVPVKLKERNTAIFGSDENQSANLTVLKDYFRWVYKYR
jgi:hypothetical protein